MSYITPKDLTTIELPSDSKYWVKVATDFTYGDIKNIGTDLEGAEASDRFLALSIKEWNLDDDSGAILEITPDNINQIKKDDVLAIMQVVNKEAGDDSEKKAS
jgi:hypothetical protein